MAKTCHGSEETSLADGLPYSRRYFYQMPSIVFELGLRPAELALYSAFRRTTDEKGLCWRSTRILAQMCHMSSGTVSKAKRTLTRPFHLLNGKPLIRITLQPGRRGGKPYHEVTIVDIWPENDVHYANKSQNTQTVEPSHHVRVPLRSSISTGKIPISVDGFTTSQDERKKTPGRKQNEERTPPYPLSGGEGITRAVNKRKTLKSQLLTVLGENTSRPISNGERRALDSVSIELTEGDFEVLKQFYAESPIEKLPPFNMRRWKLSSLARDLPHQIELARQLVSFRAGIVPRRENRAPRF